MFQILEHSVCLPKYFGSELLLYLIFKFLFPKIWYGFIFMDEGKYFLVIQWEIQKELGTDITALQCCKWKQRGKNFMVFFWLYSLYEL